MIYRTESFLTAATPERRYAMSFGSGELHKLIRKVDFLQHTTYDREGGRACPRTDLECIDPGAPHEYQWAGLGKQERVEVLNRYFDWTHFEPVQVDKIIDNIASGRERIHWFDDVQPDWRGITERHIKEWREFERMPEIEQFREAARMMKQSMTIGGDGVMVEAKWDEMNDRQRHDAVVYQLGGLESSTLPYHQWRQVMYEELGFGGEEAARWARSSATMSTFEQSLAGEAPPSPPATVKAAGKQPLPSPSQIAEQKPSNGAQPPGPEHDRGR
jgi:hypothetical protein